MKRLRVLVLLAIMTAAITLTGAAVALAGPGGGPWSTWGEVCELKNDAPGTATGVVYYNANSGKFKCFKS